MSIRPLSLQVLSVDRVSLAWEWGGGVRVAVTKEIWPLVCRNNQCFVDWLECLSCRGISEQVRLATCFSRSLSISSLLLCGISSATRHDELPVIVIMHHVCTIRVIYRSPVLVQSCTASATVTNGSNTSRFSVCIKSIKRIIPYQIMLNSCETTSAHSILMFYHKRFEVSH